MQWSAVEYKLIWWIIISNFSRVREVFLFFKRINCSSDTFEFVTAQTSGLCQPVNVTENCTISLIANGLRIAKTFTLLTRPNANLKFAQIWWLFKVRLCSPDFDHRSKLTDENGRTNAITHLINLVELFSRKKNLFLTKFGKV